VNADEPVIAYQYFIGSALTHNMLVAFGVIALSVAAAAAAAAELACPSDGVLNIARAPQWRVFRAL